MVQNRPFSGNTFGGSTRGPLCPISFACLVFHRRPECYPGPGVLPGFEPCRYGNERVSTTYYAPLTCGHSFPHLLDTPLKTNLQACGTRTSARSITREEGGSLLFSREDGVKRARPGCQVRRCRVLDIRRKAPAGLQTRLLHRGSFCTRAWCAGHTLRAGNGTRTNGKRCNPKKTVVFCIGLRTQPFRWLM